ncbi:MAG: hypothetical protein JSV86_06045 [Gemmatimonadota bacterium]|nr:MAG: hypothetical protein JSV86_06045 [Gemmatimonadota bacterium]
MLIGHVTGFGQGSAPPPLPLTMLPPELTKQLKTIDLTRTAGTFIAADPPTKTETFWLRHKSKVYIGGGIAAGALLLWLLVK